ncbi:DUF3558 domain-containing protein [Rhodococcus triatomae]|uniref:DUF3558 domain-containing protein n=1 Tax=Rhodococcus triatomae TaxID=300028 RepID=A0A1G8J0T0_9NOCA|nr:DUF3558 domain-containing protein [Rhodococcus triatomae]QNG19852.1 DUF3558 domain-containing protein [Rhodococcus triatomae]QNG24232.1 DUF3558 domain-containing protein [Rhodococcus triatomae]SDI24673.1 Protein of unknown function [Rhodococcus triatomae]
MKVRIRSVLVLLLAAAFVAACGQGDSDPADPAATGAESTTRAPRFTDQSDRPLVTYDPCLDIPESAIEEAGLDPLSKSEQDFPGDDRTFLGCTYITRRVVGVNILSTNSMLDEYIAKEAGTGQVQELTLDGRRAALLPSVNSSPACALNVETEFGYIVVTRNIFDSHPPRDQWCDGIEDMMRIFLRYLPEGA